MARPREFDEPAVLRAMVQAFWSRGYQATSIRDLEQVTGLTTGSLYKAYGSKTEIFRRCVDDYMDNLSYLAILKRHDDLPVDQALGAVMDAVIASVSAPPGRAPGCLVTNLAPELALAEPELAVDAAKRLSEMQRAIRQRLQDAQDRGQLAARHDPEALGALLMAVLQGLLVMATTTKDTDTMRRARDLGLRLLN